MKKFTTLFLPLILLSSSLSAGDKLYSFIGIQTASSTIEDTTIPTFGIRYGKQSKDIRTGISYNYGKDTDFKYQSVIVQIDTGIFKNSFKNIALKPYIGGSFGVLQKDSNIKPKKDRGYLYGPNVGFTYILNDSFDFDLGYRHLESSKHETIDHIDDITLSMHYFY